LIGQRTAAKPSPEARTVLISMNPRAGSRARHDRAGAICTALEQAGYRVRLTTDLDALHELACDCQKAGDLRTVIAIGGDGTASIVRNHVPLEVPLLPIPLGTENLLGRYLDQSHEPADVCRAVGEGVVVDLDICRAGLRYFLLMISAGFDAEVVCALHKGRRGNIRRSSYVLPTLRTMRTYRYPQMRLCWEAPGLDNRSVACRWLFGFNLPLYALGLPIAPDAVGTDGLLDVCTFERGAMWGVARYSWHVMRRSHLKLADAALTRCERFRLEATDEGEIAYQLDGDFGGILPVDVEVLPGQLRLLVTPQTASRLGFVPVGIQPAG
jgi:diacylglycerol kinase (ATP)